MSGPCLNHPSIILNVGHPDDDGLFPPGLCEGYPATLLNACSGEEAISLCKMNLSVSLVLLRPELSGLNGFDTAARIRQARPTITIIMIAGNLSLSALRLATLVGCNEIISQPVSAYEIMALCRKYVKEGVAVQGDEK